MRHAISRQRRNILLGLLLISALAVTVSLFRLEVYHSERMSPDGRYRAVAYKRWVFGLFAMMPGQGSDAPGSITLYNARTNANLGRRPVDMVSFINDIRWRDHQARIPAVASWQLRMPVLVS